MIRHRLLLVDGAGQAVCPELRIRMLREMAGPPGLSVHFRPVRNDLLFESAKIAGELAYRILRGEGIVRSQLLVEYEAPDLKLNVRGRSADLLFGLALIANKWKLRGGLSIAIAATGTLDDDGAVGGVEHTAEKVAAAARELEGNESGPSIIFYPLADAASVEAWRSINQVSPNVELRAVGHIDEALACLGYVLNKVYLRNPFRGLEHFGYADHAIFFGRDAEVREVVEQLLRREAAGAPGLMVEGASGSGKSSFLRAGVLHALAEPRFLPQSAREALAVRPISGTAAEAIWRPGLVPAQSNEAQVASSILSVWGQLAELSASPRGLEPSDLDALARWLVERWPPSYRFVWLIDQFEEIFARGLDEPLLNAFGRFLRTLQSNGVWTLASIRADATPQLKQNEQLREVFGANEGQYYLPSISGTALDSVILLPARAAGLTFELDEQGVPLDQRLREDAYRERESLPVLQFTLNELYLKRSGKQLTYTAYRELGGLSGSIATTAQAVLAAGGAESNAVAARVFRSLVSVDEAGRARRRYAPLAETARDAGQTRLLERLIEARLCVTDQRDGQAVVAFAHDTLLETLPALTEWLTREAGLLQTRDLAVRDANAWQHHAHSDDWLAGADKLALYRTLEAAEIALPETAGDFIARSARRLRKTRTVRRAVGAALAALAAAVVIGAVAFALQARKAEQAADMAARRGDFLTNLFKSADPHGGKRDITVAEVLDASARTLDASLGKEPLVEASMLGVIASTSRSLGRYEQGFSASDRQLALLRANGAPPLEVARALTLRGGLFRAHNLYVQAEEPLRQALSLLDGLSGVDSDRANALDDLGSALANSGREKEAEQVLRRAIQLSERPGRAGNADAAAPMQDLAVLLGSLGRYEEAAELAKRAVELQQRYLPDDPEILTTLGNYATILGDLHKPDQAETILRDAVGRSARILGPTHTRTLVTQVQLGEALTDLKRYEEAKSVLRLAAEGIEHNEGLESRYSGSAWGDYMIAACQGDDADQGLEVAKRIAEVRQRSFPAGDWHLAALHTEMGLCLTRLKRYAEADPLLTQARLELETARGPKFYMTQLNYQTSQELYAATGRPADAAQMAAKIVH